MAATFFLQFGLTRLDLVLMVVLIVGGVLLLTGMPLAGAFILLPGAAVTGCYAVVKALAAGSDQFGMVVQLAVAVLAVVAAVFATRQLISILG